MDNIIPNSFLLGLFIPAIFGLIFDFVYKQIKNILTKIGIKKKIILVVVFEYVLTLLIYILLSAILGQSVNSNGIYSSIGIATGIAVLSITLYSLFKKIKGG
jgi:hypothetical protein